MSVDANASFKQADFSFYPYWITGSAMCVTLIESSVKFLYVKKKLKMYVETDGKEGRKCI